MNFEEFSEIGLEEGLSDDQIINAWKELSTEESKESTVHNALMEGYDPDFDPVHLQDFNHRFDIDETTRGYLELDKLEPEQAQFAAEVETSGVLQNYFSTDNMRNAAMKSSVINPVHSAALGFTKATMNLAAGASDFAKRDYWLSKTGIGYYDNTSAVARKVVDSITQEQQNALSSYLLEGDKVKYYTGALMMGAGDMFGQIAQVGGAMKYANQFIKHGKAFKFVSKGTKYKDILATTAGRSAFMGAYSFISTEGSIDERLKAMGIMMAASSTPIVSSLLPTKASAKIIDAAVGAGISYGTQWEDAQLRAKQRAEDIGRPDMEIDFLIAEGIQLFGADIVFAGMAESVKANQLEAHRKSIADPIRAAEKANTETGYRKAMKKRYGFDYETKMSVNERVFLLNVKTLEQAVLGGRIDDSTLNPNRSETELRRPPVEEPPPEMIPPPKKVAEPKAPTVEKDVINTPVKMIEPPPVKEIDVLEVPRNVKKVTLTSKESGGKAMTIYKFEDGVIKDMQGKEITDPVIVDAIIKKVGIKKRMTLDEFAEEPAIFTERQRLNDIYTKKAQAKEPPPPEDRPIFAGYLKEAMVDFVAGNIRAGTMTKRQFNTFARETKGQYLYFAKEEMNAVWKSASEKVKSEEKLIQDVERVNLRADVRKAVKVEREKPVAVKATDIIKDRIKAHNKGFKLGKKKQKEIDDLKRKEQLAKAKKESRQKIDKIRSEAKKKREELKRIEKERAENRKEIRKQTVDYIRQSTSDTVIRNKFIAQIETRNITTDNAVNKLIRDVDEFIVKDVNAKQRKQYERIITRPLGKYRAFAETKALRSIKKQLEERGLDSFTTKELKEISEQFYEIRKAAILKTKEVHKSNLAKLEAITDQMDSLLKTVKVPEKYRAEVKKKVTDIPLSLTRQFLRPDRLFDMLDGGKGKFNGIFFKTFVDARRLANNQIFKNTNARIDTFESMLRQLGVRPRDLGEKVHFDANAEKFTIEQLIGVYALSKQTQGRDAVLYGIFNGNETAFNNAINYIANVDKYRAIGDFLIADYRNNYDRLAEAYTTNTGKALEDIPYYMPLVRRDFRINKGAEDIESMLSGKDPEGAWRPEVSAKFAQKRKFISDQHQSAVDLNVISTWRGMIERHEHYINQYSNVRAMRAVVKSQGNKIKAKFGQSALNEINSYIDVVANPYKLTSNAPDVVSKLSKMARRNVAVAYLAYNFKTILKQIPSMGFYLAKVNPIELFGSMARLTEATKFKDGKIQNDIMKLAHDKDPVLKQSSIMRELDELRANNPLYYNRLRKALGEDGMKGIIAVDQMVRVAGWNAVYEKALRNNKSEAEAVKEARDATLKSQPTSRPEELPSSYRSNEGMAWLLQFSNQLNQIANMSFYDIPAAVRGKNIPELSGVAAGLALSGMSMWVIDNGRMPEDEEDISDALTGLFFTAIPVAGGAFNQYRKGYAYEQPPVKAAKEVTNIYKKLISEEDDLKWSDGATIAALGKLPVVATKRVSESIAEEDITKLFGITTKEKDKPPARRERRRRGRSSRRNN